MIDALGLRGFKPPASFAAFGRHKAPAAFAGMSSLVAQTRPLARLAAQARSFDALASSPSLARLADAVAASGITRGTKVMEARRRG